MKDDVKYFFDCFYEALPKAGTVRGAYRLAELEYNRVYGRRKYKSYESFRRCKSYYVTKNRHMKERDA